MAREERMPPRRAGSALPRVSALHILTLVSLAVAHPLYDVLRHENHAPFFIAHQSSAVDIWLFVFFLSLVLPAVLFAPLWLLSLVLPGLARGLYALLLLVLFSAFFMPIPAKLLPGAGDLSIVLALAAGAIATLLYLVADRARTFVTFMSVGIVVSPLLFLSSASMKPFLAAPADGDFGVIPASDSRPDVVVIIFDELPLTSLLDGDREIDEGRYPNFQRLAATSTWYRNTTSVHYSTSGALSSLLVGGDFEKYRRRVHGNAPPPGGAVDRARVPSSLFSMLETDWRAFSIEPMTKLARETEDARAYVPPLSRRMRDLVVDSSILYGHLVAPGPVRSELPVIEGQWRDFLGAGSEPPKSVDWPYADLYEKSSGAKRFIDLLERRNAPSFYFLHLLLPHFPFLFNERGQIHFNKFRFMTMRLREATGSNGWPDETTANLAYQAHLLQLGFTDLLLGRILDRLEELDLFEESLVVVAADHGISFYWDSVGLPADKLARVQASDTLLVPLLIKLPGQVSGIISDRPVQTIDIVPTLADILEMEIDWEIDGVSALDDDPPARERFAYLPRRMTVESIVEPDHLSLKRKLELFGTRELDGIYRMGPRGGLVGRRVSSFPASISTATIKLNDPGLHRSDPKSSRLAAYVEGQIESLPENIGPRGLTIAVAIDGVIRSTTRTTSAAISTLTAEDTMTSGDDEGVYFLARVPPESFTGERNAITIHAVMEDDHGRPTALIQFTGRER